LPYVVLLAAGGWGRTVARVDTTGQRDTKSGPAWTVGPSSVTGKRPDQSRCEDILVETTEFAAVIDGATDKSGLTYVHDGDVVTSGRFAALTLAESLAGLDPRLGPHAAAAVLVTALDTALGAQRPGLAAHQRPAASIVVVNISRDELWWVGDCQFALAGPTGAPEVCSTTLAVDQAAIAMRCAFLAARAAAGAAWDPFSGEPDPARAVILPLLQLQGALANTTGQFGYGVLNGTPIPAGLVGSRPLAGLTRVVLASDGYPELCPGGVLSLESAEAYLARALEADPACTGVLAGTKPQGPAMASFDDRAWLDLTR
jgi:hypothetical protein